MRRWPLERLAGGLHGGSKLVFSFERFERCLTQTLEGQLLAMPGPA